MVETSEEIIKKDFLQQLRQHLERLRAGDVRVHLPERCQLHTRQANAIFHPTPEFFIQTGGATDFVCPGSKFRLNTGEMCMIPRGLPHAETPIDLKTPYRVLVVAESVILEGYADDRRRIMSDPCVLWEKRVRPIEWMHYLDDLEEISSLAREDRDAFMRSLLEVFLLGVLHELERKSELHQVVEPPLITETRKFVRIHISESSLSVREIANALECTPDHLSRQFHQSVGIKLMAWIAQERITLAKNLLKETHHNIAEVGWAAGFNEPSYFIRVFKRYTGHTPRVYRVRVSHSSVEPSSV
jgi:AraC-like DNA-binding protein